MVLRIDEAEYSQEVNRGRIPIGGGILCPIRTGRVGVSRRHVLQTLYEVLKRSIRTAIAQRLDIGECRCSGTRELSCDSSSRQLKNA